MSLALNKPRLDNLAAEIWKSAERLRGKFKAYEYQNVILPMIVIRRLERRLMAWRVRMRAEVLAKRPSLTGAKLTTRQKAGGRMHRSPTARPSRWPARYRQTRP